MTLQHLNSITLDREASLLGITPDSSIYVETFDEESTAQHIVTLQGEFLKTVNDGILSLPADAIKPQPAKVTLDLNFSGARFRGLREADRILETVKPLTIPEKMLFKVPVLGIAESAVLSEAEIDGRYVLCRRVRIAYALPEVRRDDQPYDYDTLTLYLAHFYSPDVDLVESMKGLPEAELNRPMDCIAANGYLFIADENHIHIWKGSA